MGSQTLYEILGVPTTATPEEIKSAYRRQAMKWHPDRNPGSKAEAEKRFKEIGYAYKVLSDPEARTEYDRELAGNRSSSFEQTHEFRSHHSTRENAEAVFFEQMLDLAFELARRGYGSEKILKTLLALDCPDSVARSVAKRVSEMSANAGGRSTPNENGHGYQKSERPGENSVRFVKDSSWEEIEPFYEAVIGGVHAEDRMPDQAYELAMAESKRGVVGYALSAILILGGTIGGMFVSFGWWVAGGGGLLLFGTIFWRVFKAGSKDFRREMVMRYYLAAFESFHTARPLPKNVGHFNWGGWFFWAYWMAYRRMTWFALLGIAGMAIISSVFTLIEIENPQWSKGLNGAFIGGMGAVFGTIANRAYFLSARRRIAKVMGMPQDRALIKLRMSGGTNGSSWILYVFLMIALMLPVLSYQVEVEEQRAAALQAQEEAAQIAQQKAEQEAHEQFLIDQKVRLSQAIRDLEMQYPELNQNDPRYSQALVDEALARMSKYVAENVELEVALRRAVADMVRDANASRAGYR